MKQAANGSFQAVGVQVVQDPGIRGSSPVDSPENTNVANRFGVGLGEHTSRSKEGAEDEDRDEDLKRKRHGG